MTTTEETARLTLQAEAEGFDDARESVRALQEQLDQLQKSQGAGATRIVEDIDGGRKLQAQPDPTPAAPTGDGGSGRAGGEDSPPPTPNAYDPARTGSSTDAMGGVGRDVASAIGPILGQVEQAQQALAATQGVIAALAERIRRLEANNARLQANAADLSRRAAERQPTALNYGGPL